VQAVRNAQNNYVSAKGFIRQLDVLRLAASLLIANSFTRLIRPIEPLVQENKRQILCTTFMRYLYLGLRGVIV
jgi:hypothetical protein